MIVYDGKEHLWPKNKAKEQHIGEEDDEHLDEEGRVGNVSWINKREDLAIRVS